LLLNHPINRAETGLCFPYLAFVNAIPYMQIIGSSSLLILIMDNGTQECQAFSSLILRKVRGMFGSNKMNCSKFRG